MSHWDAGDMPPSLSEGQVPHSGVLLLPDPLSKSCLSLEMFVESWLHCPPRISISEKTEIIPHGFCLQWRVRGTAMWEK